MLETLIEHNLQSLGNRVSYHAPALLLPGVPKKRNHDFDNLANQVVKSIVPLK